MDSLVGPCLDDGSVSTPVALRSRSMTSLIRNHLMTENDGVVLKPLCRHVILRVVVAQLLDCLQVVKPHCHDAGLDFLRVHQLKRRTYQIRGVPRVGQSPARLVLILPEKDVGASGRVATAKIKKGREPIRPIYS